MVVDHLAWHSAALDSVVADSGAEELASAEEAAVTAFELVERPWSFGDPAYSASEVGLVK